MNMEIGFRNSTSEVSVSIVLCRNGSLKAERHKRYFWVLFQATPYGQATTAAPPSHRINMAKMTTQTKQPTSKTSLLSICGLIQLSGPYQISC